MEYFTQEEPRLPTQYPLKIALIIYTKRLLVLLFVALVNIYLFALYLVSNKEFASSQEGRIAIVAILIMTPFMLRAFLLIYGKNYHLFKYGKAEVKQGKSKGHISVQGDGPASQRWHIFLEELKGFTISALLSLADGAFLVIWAFAQVLLDRLGGKLQVFGVDSWVLVTIQLLFAIVTLLPILGHIFRNISRGFILNFKFKSN